MCVCVCGCQCGGVECVYEILCDTSRSTATDEDDDEVSRHASERVRSEAAGVVAQLTSPSLIISSQLADVRRTSLLGNMADLIPALTSQCGVSNSLAAVVSFLFCS